MCSNLGLFALIWGFVYIFNDIPMKSALRGNIKSGISFGWYTTQTKWGSRAGPCINTSCHVRRELTSVPHLEKMWVFFVMN